LREIPYLVKVFGLGGFFQLLDSQTITFDCDPTSIGESNEPGRLGLCAPDHILSGTEYLFFRLTSDPRKYLSGCFAEFNTSPQLAHLPRADVKKLKLGALDSIILDCGERGAEAPKQFHNDVLTVGELITSSVADQLQRAGKLQPRMQDVEAKVYESAPNVYRLETTLGEESHLSPEELRELGKKALFAVANMNLRIEDMQRHSALSGFIPDEAFAFGRKTELLTHQSHASAADRRFERVLTISNLPQPDYNQTDIKIDVNKLLKARSSPECSEFREWLQTSDDYSGEQIHRMVRGIKARFMEFVHAPVGKAVRILLAAKLGATPARSIALGALDMFLLERLCPAAAGDVPEPFVSINLQVKLILIVNLGLEPQANVFRARLSQTSSRRGSALDQTLRALHSRWRRNHPGLSRHRLLGLSSAVSL
jgi:hypothetical protein